MTDKPKPPRVVEAIPSIDGGLSAIATGNAPIIFFDEVTNFGTYNGIAHITLIAMRFTTAPDGMTATDSAVSAFLRMNYHALKSLNNVTGQMLAQLAPPPPDASIN